MRFLLKRLSDPDFLDEIDVVDLNELPTLSPDHDVVVHLLREGDCEIHIMDDWL